MATRLWRRVPAVLLTVGIFAVILWRIPFEALTAALAGADYTRFLLLMVPNTVFYFCWDTLVLALVIRWFHGPVRYFDLLPARAASYVVALFNTNAARGALAAYLTRQLGAPFLQLGSTVIFLVLTEYTHLVAWATLGIVQIRDQVGRDLVWVPVGVALFWLMFLAYARLHVTPSRLVRWLLAPRDWSLFRTFRVAPVRRYGEIVLVRAPMFFVSLCLHYYAAPSFGIDIPFAQMLAFLPVIFMIAALPVTVAHLGTTQAAWIYFFAEYAPPARLLAFSLAAHLTFTGTRALVGLLFLPRAYEALMAGRAARPLAEAGAKP